MKIVLLPAVCLWLLFAVSGFAQQTPQSLADAELPSLLTIYKDFTVIPSFPRKRSEPPELSQRNCVRPVANVTENFGKYDNQAGNAMA